jgi:protein-L-isoaspartate(D-aspartate) O-methyltransferase
MTLEEIRQFYAEEIQAVANLQTKALVKAFATVPREHFLGPGPWKIATPDALQSPSGHATRSNYRSTEDDNPRHLYHNVVVAIDVERQLNNGQPGSLATWIDGLELKEGNRAVHIGCAVGYYTAIIAETVGPGGHVVGVELDEELARRARQNLAYLPQAQIIQGDGGSYNPEATDAILVNAGATFVRSAWLDSLRPGGKLIVPLTIAEGEKAHGLGFMLKIARQENGYAARFLSSIMIFPCIGSRDEGSEQRLREALMKGTWGLVQSLRRDTHESGDTCWLHGADFCLSTSPLTADMSTH